MADNFTPTPVKGLKTHNTGAPTNDNIGVLFGLANAAAPTYTEGDQVLASLDLSGNLRVSVVTSGTLNENLAQVNGTTVLVNAGATGAGSQRVTVAQDTTTIAGSAPGTAGTPSANVVTVQGITSGTSINVAQATAANLNATVTQGPAGTAAGAWFGKVTDGTNVAAVKAASTAAAATDPALVVAISPNNTVAENLTQIAGNAVSVNNGVSGTGTLRVNIASDNTPFLVKVSADGSANSVTDPIWVELTNGVAALGTITNPVYVDNTGTTGASKFAYLTSASLAAGASVTLASPAITTGKTGYLVGVHMSSSIIQKVIINTYNGTTATPLAVQFVPAETSFTWNPGTNLMYPFAGGATDVWQLVIKNMDNLNAADVYATVEWIEQ